jgi:hypothetical protein
LAFRIDAKRAELYRGGFISTTGFVSSRAEARDTRWNVDIILPIHPW